mgnify:CR=1 FL=1
MVEFEGFIFDDKLYERPTLFSCLMVVTSLRSFRQCLGRKVLILGDVRTGKTKITAKLLNEALRAGHESEITVIDLAPAATKVRGRKIGGRLFELMALPKELRYLAPAEVETPRLSASSSSQLLALARANHEAVTPLLRQFLAALSPILFVNDISIYFHSGTPDLMFEAAERAETFVGNGYYGEYFAFDHGTGVSERERKLMDLFAAKMDTVINLQKGQAGSPRV